MSMQTVLRVEDGKYVAGLGGSTKASQVFMSDGETSVEDAFDNLEGVTLQKETSAIAASASQSITGLDLNNVQDIFIVTSFNQSFTYASIFPLPYIEGIKFRHYHYINGNSVGMVEAQIANRTTINVSNGVNEDVKLRIYVRKAIT